MFFETAAGGAGAPSFDIDELLRPFLHLDKSLFKGEEDGDACFKKFSNEGKGVAVSERSFIDRLATTVRADSAKPDNWLKLVDLFVLYANHIDQQRYGAKLEKLEKERLVLNYLEAALHISPAYDYAHLDRYTPRELSSHAQLLHYLGKARRYAGIPAEARVLMLSNALTIANYLAAKECSEEEDPHAYKNRISTYELPVNYCLRDLGRYDEAAAIIIPQLASKSAFHVGQAHCQLAENYFEQFGRFGINLDKAMFHAQAAVEISKTQSSVLVQYNARVCLMKVMQAAGDVDVANALAEEIIAEMDANSECGAKPLHREAAQKIKDANASAALKP